jgi:thiosulfate dehydrogenase [quinone] large subunit
MFATLRRLIAPLALLAAAIVVYIEAPWSAFGLAGIAASPTVETFLAGIFWSLAVLVVAGLLLEQRATRDTAPADSQGIVGFMFRNPKAGLAWLSVRLFVGFSWLEAGLHKAQGSGWLDGGSSLAGFWKGAVAIPATGSPKITFDWYRDFLNILITNHAEKWFSWLIVFGEIAIGVGLIVGAVVGVAAFFGALMNMSFMLAGSASTNPVLFLLAVALLLGRRVSGYYGLDRYVNEFLATRHFTRDAPTTHLGQPMAA